MNRTASNTRCLHITKIYDEGPTGTQKMKVRGNRGFVCCPICDVRISSSLINMHIDVCLERADRRACTDCLYSKPAKQKQTQDQERSEDAKKSKLFESTRIEHTAPLPLLILTATNPSKQRELFIQEHSTVPGLYLIEDFVDSDEEAAIIRNLDEDQTPWHHSNFNGHCLSKRFGVRTHLAPPRLVRPNDPAAGEMDIPPYLAIATSRLRLLLEGGRHSLPSVLHDFTPNECNANSYETALGHFLTPHFDDRALSGPILMNLSLGCDAHMTFHAGEEHAGIDVRLPARCLQLVTGPARYSYRHSIRADAISGPRRVSVTWRQAGARGSPPVAAAARGAASASPGLAPATRP